MTSLKEKSFFAVLWNSIGGGVDLILSFIISVILSQLLTPDDFGTVAIVTVIYALSLVFMQFGFEAALIQKKDTEDVHFNSVFTFGVVMGLLFSVSLYLCAPFIANYYEKPILESISKIMSGLFIFEALMMTQKIHMKKFLYFKKLNLILISSKIIAGSIGIYMALAGYGLWSLVTQILLSSILNACLVLMTHRINLKLEFDKAAIMSLWETNIYVFLSNVSSTFSARLDSLIIGKSLGFHFLGLFDKGKNLSNLAKGIPSRFAMKPLFSTLSDMQDDKARLTNAVKKIFSINAFVFTPFLLFLIWYAQDVINVIYGEQWIEAAPFLKLFMVIAILYILRIPFTYLLLAKGKAKTTFWIDLVINSVSVIIIAILAPINVFWMIKGLIVIKTIDVLIYLYYGCKEIDFTFLEFIKVQGFYYILSLVIMASFSIVNNNFILLSNGHLGFVILAGIVLGVSYLSICFLLKPKGLQETSKMVSAFILK